MRKPVWSVIDRPSHRIDRTGYLWENRPLSTPRKSLSHVRLNLLKLHVLGEWESEASAPAVQSMLLEPIPALGFLLGPCDYFALALVVFVCVPVAERVYFCPVCENMCSTKFGMWVCMHVCV